MDWAYIAGFFDGEGSICLARGGAYRYKGEPRVPTYRCGLRMTNTHEGVLHEIAAFAGVGAVYRSHRPPRLPIFNYVVNGSKCAPVLRGMLPHLVVKRARCELALVFIVRRGLQTTRPFEQADYDMVAQMQTLNARRPDRGSPIRPIPAPRTHKALEIP